MEQVPMVWEEAAAIVMKEVAKVALSECMD